MRKKKAVSNINVFILVVIFTLVMGVLLIQISQRKKEDIKIQMFVCFHKNIHPSSYPLKLEERKHLTYYGVRDKDPSNPENIIYEYDLEYFNPDLQRKKYNEASCIYHVYTNKLYLSYDYVGFCQYDMVFDKDIFKNIKSQITKEPNTIFYMDFFKWQFIGGQQIIIRDFGSIKNGLETYNKTFHTNFNETHLIDKMPICNTFLMPKRMYEKYMYWILYYYGENININNPEFDNGHMIEALTGMFLCLETYQGAVFCKMDLRNDVDLKLSHGK